MLVAVAVVYKVVQVDLLELAELAVVEVELKVLVQVLQQLLLVLTV